MSGNVARALPLTQYPEPFLTDVVQGLSQAPQKLLHCKYFYDEEGSRLFDQICELPEYYPTRTEQSIMNASIDAIAEALGPDCVLIEYGSGSSMKTRLLLDRLERLGAYVPIDISGDYLESVAQGLRQDYPDIPIHPVAADYTAEISLPKEVRRHDGRVVYFPGSTIGNFHREDAQAFLDRIRRLLGSGGHLLMGVDLKKDEEVLRRAYNDAAGVTAAFNMNVLRRINNELDGDFDLNGFEHDARYDRRHGRIEMHLVSLRPQEVRIAGGCSFAFEEGETIRTECSYKYSKEDFAALAARAGFDVMGVWTDPRQLFSVQLLRAQ